MRNMGTIRSDLASLFLEIIIEKLNKRGRTQAGGQIDGGEREIRNFGPDVKGMNPSRGELPKCGWMDNHSFRDRASPC